LKLVHAADLHIDSPLLGLERYEGAPIARAREATRTAFRRVIDITLRESARFLILAGDVFDGDWRDANTGLFFVSELARLRDVDCRVLLLRGNHDHELTRTLLYRLPDFVHVFGTPGQTEKHSYVFEEHGVAFHGVSYPQKKVTDSLLPHYPAPRRDVLNVGVLHTNCTGSTAHDRYAPCSVAELSAFGYGYWALGHVHAHQILGRDPWVVYPGNTQGRHARETGPKGCVVLTTEASTVADVSFVETAAMRFVLAEVALGEEDGEDEILERVDRELDRLANAENAEGRMLSAVRLSLRGACRAHAMLVREPERIAQNIRSLALGRGESLWLEKILFETRPVVPLEELRASAGLVGDLLRALERLRTEDGEPDLQKLAIDVLAPVRKRLGPEADAIKLPLTDTPTLIEIVGQVEALLAERLTEREDS
jgi:DNA repair exonuclease SbcCD nuclease subunit